MPFTLTRIQNFPDDGVVSLVHCAPILGGPGAILTFKQADRIRCAWIYGDTAKLIDDDVFDQDAFKDADGVCWLATDGRLYAVVSHSVDGPGANARLYLGSMDVSWAASAYSLLDNRIDQRATAIVNAALQLGSDGDQDMIAALQTKIASLEAQLGTLQTTIGHILGRMTDAGAKLKGE